MIQLTTKELSFIEDEIRAEEITAKTMSWCASQCKEAGLKETLHKMAESHHLKVIELSNYLNRSTNLH
ncbi:hypothetical protein SAMN05192533_101251 [Mesobacillus persicus]|uniref:Uncharacterized protein n=1 Tax=Mesobacillus persicus TaxID=930146 RepID=A0A1H7W3H2_9BACI|nr:hypothetical protein SAMN05192533_101251 [Mesobacillus persicus]